MDAVPFRIVLEFLESHQFKLMGRKGTHRVFRRGNELIVIEVHDGKVSTIDFQTIQEVLEGGGGGGGPRGGRFGRRA